MQAPGAGMAPVPLADGRSGELGRPHASAGVRVLAGLERGAGWVGKGICGCCERAHSSPSPDGTVAYEQQGTGCGHDSRWMTLLRGMPPAVGGLALGLCGLGGLLIEFQRAPDLSERIAWILEWCIWLTSVVAMSLLVPVVLRASLCTEELKMEMREPALIPGHVASLYALMLICSRNIGSFAGDIASVLLTALIGPWCALVIRFVERCWKTRTYPEPFYNPPTNPAVLVLAGISANMAPWLLMSCFIIGVVGGVSLVPAQAWRCLRDARHVAPNVSIWMMQAPASINAVMWGLLRRDKIVLSMTAPWLSAAALDSVSHALFWYSLLLVCFTLVATWNRRNLIQSQGFNTRWAALTFPSCSTSIAALQYSGFDGGSASPAHLPLWSRTSLQIYALTISGLTCALVVAVAAGVIWQGLLKVRTVWHTETACDSCRVQKQAASSPKETQQVASVSTDGSGTDCKDSNTAVEHAPYPLKGSDSLVFEELELGMQCSTDQTLSRPRERLLQPECEGP